ncbi:MAG: hypothetical protein J5982_02530 [Bacilli bacterium]|nr:hypothetical protein [Bacilli bacterium]
MLFTMIGDWFNNTMAFFFVKLLDTMAYGLLATAYNIFDAVSKLNLFGGNAAGEELYNTITARFYTVLSVLMIFVFAYQLIMMIIDPDGKEQKASGTLVKDTLVSIVAIILLPTLFKYMALFQTHVISNNTIGAMILGQNGTAKNQDPGKNISLMVFMSFYHPNNTTYSTFFDENGELRSDAEAQCKAESADDAHPDGRTSTCEKFVEGLGKWKNQKAVGIGDLTGIKDLRHWVGDSMEYMWILSTGAGIITAWFFFAYSIAMGTRAVKLGVLQIIAPIPLVFRVFPQTRKTYETWFGEIKKTYLEVFIRLGVIFFIIALIQQVPTFINIIFDANNGAGSGLTKCIATVCLILGMLQFAKDAPDLFKTLFSNGGNLFSGLNFSPKVRSHVESNPYAMKGIGTLAGAASSGIGAMAQRYKESYAAGGGKYTGTSNSIKSALVGATALPRGLISGGRSGFKNSPTKLTRDELKNTAAAGVRAGHESLDNRAFKDTRDNIKNFVGDVFDNNGSTSFGESWQNFRTNQKKIRKDWAAKEVEESKTKTQEFKDFMFGTNRDYTKAASGAETISSSAGALEDLAKVENDKVKTRKQAVEERVNAGETYAHLDGRTYSRMYKDVNELKTKYAGHYTTTKDYAGNITSLTTDDGQIYTIGTDGKVISRNNNAQLVNAKRQVEQAIASNTQFVSGNTTYSDISSDFDTMRRAMYDGSPQIVMSTGSNGERIREFTTANNEKYIEYTFSDGTKHIETADGGVKFTIDANNVVTSKETRTIDASGKTVSTKVANAQLLLDKIENKINQTAIYNVEQVYDEFTEAENSNYAKALSDFSDARATQAAVMLQTLKDNSSSFSTQYSGPNGDAETFATDFGETIEEFLKRMSDKTTTSVTSDDAKRFKRVKKIMGTEVKRSKTNAEAEKKAKEAREASKPKKDESKK